MTLDAKDRMIIALDVPSVPEAAAMVERIGDAGSFYKIGMELTYGGGLPFVTHLVKSGKKVFLDLKLHDIPHTVEQATAQVAGLGATYLTVHAYPQTLAAAVKGRGNSGLQILGVSVLTSMNDADLANAGYGLGVADLVKRRARQAYETGVDGLICSAIDIVGVRETVGQGLKLVTPGIRPTGTEIGDQKRVMTPAEAIRAGADQLVIGRPVTAAADPRMMAISIVHEIEAA